jgi:ribose transport system ATP-binding protein
MLPPHQVEQLYQLIAEVRGTGASVLYVSHRMHEIFELADRVTVLRGGRVVATTEVDRLTPRELATLMVGEDVDPEYRAEIAAQPDAPVALEARDIRSRYLDGVSFQLHEGEVLGLAGLPGSGSDELPYALAGALEGASGRVRVPAHGDRWLDLDAPGLVGIPLVPADRGRQGVMPSSA